MCQSCNSFTKDFPIHELLSAMTMEDINKALTSMWSHMKKVGNNHEYTIDRALELLEAVSRDLNLQLVKIIKQQHQNQENLMTMNYQQFKMLYGLCEQVFKAWSVEYSNFSMVNSKTKKCRSCYFEHIDKVKRRIDQINSIRMMHNKLETVIQKIVQKETREKQRPSDSIDMKFLQFNNEDINYAYKLFTEMDVLDFSNQGEQNMKEAEKQYNQRIDKVESMITAQLRDKLGAAQNANEMLKIFSKFKGLLMRPRIKNAI